MKRIFTLFCLLVIFSSSVNAQHSVARRWNEVMLEAIRHDRARPPVQARNLYHVSMAMYDAWAAYDGNASKVLLGNTINGNSYAFNGIPLSANVDSDRNVAISYAAYRILYHRFNSSPDWFMTFYRFDTLMSNLGLDKNYTATNYASGNPADLGNYIASQVINYGFVDGANEIGDYTYINYTPENVPLPVNGSSISMQQPNRWQPLSIPGALDQSGNPVPSIQEFVCPEWGRIIPFAMSPDSCVHYTKNGGDFPVYFNPGEPPALDTSDATNPSSQFFKWGHVMVAIWSSHHDPDDTTMWDISPNGIGNITTYPSNIAEAQSFYNMFEGGSIGTGHTINPATSLPYSPQLVKRGDYTRVLSQFWADGPKSETPPGHWYTLINDAMDHPSFVKKIGGVGSIVSDLEYDVKSYLTLGGGMHDAAIAAWGIKGWYDSPRPISAIRLMAQYGQSSDSTLPSYHPAGLPLIPGYIELIQAGDSLVGNANENLNKIKIKAWKGFDSILNATTDIGHAGWILGTKWTPYQRKTFVTPPFAGYVSGHSTYSRVGATLLEALTGNPYFPGGMAEYTVNQNSGFLVFEKGPSANIHLQWATYRDASDEASLSRIWGSIHPPFDDYTGRQVGQQIGDLAYAKAITYFGNTALPITLGSFNAIENDCEINLTWETKSEMNCDHFEIYSSEHGNEFTKLVAQKKAIGNSTSSTQYQVTDKSPFATNIYQLVSIDQDGKRQIFPLVKANLTQCNHLENSNWCSIYPNPTSGYLKLIFENNSDATTAVITLIDISGRQLFIKSTDLILGNNESNIDLSQYVNGTYFLKVELPNGQVYSQSVSILK